MIFLCITIFVDLPGTTLLWDEVQNTGHIPVFGIIALALLMFLRSANLFRDKSAIYLYLSALVLTVLLGVFVEVCQSFLQRDADINDVLHDAIGAGAFLSLSAARKRQVAVSSRGRELSLRIGFAVPGLLLLLLGFYPVISLSVAYIDRYKSFPRLTEFGASWNTRFVSLQRAILTGITEGHDIHSTDVNVHGARLTLLPGTYPGITIVETTADWTGYTSLLFSVFSQLDEPVAVVLRIHDRRHNFEFNDRYNQRLVVKPGRNDYQIPLRDVQNAPVARVMDMQQIASIMLFCIDLKTPITLDISDFWLEK